MEARASEIAVCLTICWKVACRVQNYRLCRIHVSKFITSYLENIHLVVILKVFFNANTISIYNAVYLGGLQHSVY